MQEIQGVKLEPARNAAHYELTHSILEFAQKCRAVTENMTDALTAFRLAVEHEGNLLGISLKSDYTEPLKQTDHERDGYVSSAKSLVNALMKNPNAVVAEAARELMTQMTSLKVDIEANYLQQTGQIDILLATLQGKYAEQVETCRIGVIFDYLKEANDRMHELLNLRDVEQAPRTGTAMEDARRATDTAYRAFIKLYNAWILVNAAALATDDLGTTLFSTEANAKIEYFKRYVLKEPTSSKPGDVTGGSESDSENSEGSEDSEDSGNQGGSGSLTPDPDAPTNPDNGGNTNPGGGYVPPSNGGGFD